MNELLNLSEWMCPLHCTPSTFFRWYVIFFGMYIFSTYAMFAYQVLVKLRTKLVYILGSKVPRTLGLVFVLCAITHFAHSYAYINQYSKLILLVTYPILAYLHTSLFSQFKKNLGRVSGLKNTTDLKAMEKEIKDLKLEIASKDKAMSKAVILNDLKIIKSIL